MTSGTLNQWDPHPCSSSRISFEVIHQANGYKQAHQPWVILLLNIYIYISPLNEYNIYIYVYIYAYMYLYMCLPVKYILMIFPRYLHLFSVKAPAKNRWFQRQASLVPWSSACWTFFTETRRPLRNIDWAVAMRSWRPCPTESSCAPGIRT